MPSLTRAIDYMLHNRAQFMDSCVKNLGFLIPDRQYIQLRFRFNMGYWPDLKNPETFNEKINWLKLYDRKPVYTTMVDKYAVKDYVSKIIGEEYIIPTLGVWPTPEEIEWNKLPDKFVLKTTHGGGSCGVIVCMDKDTFDEGNAISKLSDSMKADIYSELREWPYKNVEKRIIAEQYLDSKGKELNDYKFFCFNGKVRCFKVDFNRFVEHHANYYSRDCELLTLGEVVCTPQPEHHITFPDNIYEMFSIAEKISAGHPFLRVDLYNIEGKIYFGETTFFPAGGMGRFTEDVWDKTLGSWINL